MLAKKGGKLMNSNQIYRKTMPFVWAKLMLGLVTVAISIVLFAILMGLGWLFNSDGLTVIMFIIWVSAVGVVRFALMHYLGYLVKVGHVAVIIEALTTGLIPDNQVEFGKKKVTERFVTSNIYFTVDMLVSGAVKQIQRVVEKAGNALDFIPGIGAVVGLAKFFIDIFLGYIDECCLGYTFYKKEQGAFKSAADGVVIYAQNWKKIIKDAFKTMVLAVVALIVLVLITFVALGLLFRILHWSGFVAFVIACFIAWAIKFSFIDSYILVKMMSSYMEVAPMTQITNDLYSKLSNMSTKFKELLNKGQVEQPSPQQDQAPAGDVPEENDTPLPSTIAQVKTVFCGQCGEKNDVGTKFCGSCGAKIG
jgi:hypothetical protein